MNIIQQFIDQAELRHGRRPERLILTPPAVAVLTARGVTVPAAYGGTVLELRDPAELSFSGKPVGRTVALVVRDVDAFTGLVCVDVD